MAYSAPPIDLVIGTRPNIVKAGPLLATLRNCEWCTPRLIFLAQHTQDAMTTQTLEDLGVEPAEVIRLQLNADGVGRRMGEMMHEYALNLQSSPPRLVVTFGDVDSTLAAAYAAKRLQIPVAHVEAGLRSGDLSMPEELNRRMVDSISDLLFTTTPGASENLLAEGKRARDIHLTGNVMIDALMSVLARDDTFQAQDRLMELFGLTDRTYAVATFHRPSNVDSSHHLQRTIELLEAAAERLPVVFPIHPRSQISLERYGLRLNGRVKTIPPLRYSDFVALLSRARVALTDSGGLQEETSVLGIPCLTFRPNTERPETIKLGTNRLARPQDAGAELDRVLAAQMPAPCTIPLWDGHAAQRIAASLRNWLHRHRAEHDRTH